MKKTTVYLIFWLNTLITSDLMAQEREIYDIKWEVESTLPANNGQPEALGLAGAMSGVLNNQLIIIGGTNFPDTLPWLGGVKKYYKDIYVYEDAGEGLFPVLSSKKNFFPINLAYGAICQTKLGLLLIGGENENGLSKKTFALKFQGEDLLVDSLPDLPTGITNASAVSIDHQIYLIGGEMDDQVSDRIFRLDLENLDVGWNLIGRTPKPVSHAVLLQDQKHIFLIGGRKRNPGNVSYIYDEVWTLDLKKQQWHSMNRLPHPLAAASGVKIGNELFIFSGDEGKTFHQAEQLIADIALEQDPNKKEQLNQRKMKVQSTHPGFSKNVLKFDLIANKWVQLKTAMPYGTVTTQAVSLGNKVIIPAGEIRAGVRTPSILVGQLIESK